jgi:hypothetical protein
MGAGGEVAIPVIDGLNLLPSIATLPPLNTSIWRQSSTNLAQALQIPWPLSMRKSALVLWSGTSRPVDHITLDIAPGFRVGAVGLWGCVSSNPR